jgi:hypothetical protein
VGRKLVELFFNLIKRCGRQLLCILEVGGDAPLAKRL